MWVNVCQGRFVEGGLLSVPALGTGPAPPLWDEGLMPAPPPLAGRRPPEATDPRQVQGHEERVPEHPAVHHRLRLHQPLHQVLVLDSPRQSPGSALKAAPVPWACVCLSACPCTSALASPCGGCRGFLEMPAPQAHLRPLCTSGHHVTCPVWRQRLPVDVPAGTKRRRL